MNLQTISAEIARLSSLVEDWKRNGNVPDIEREIAYDIVKGLYSSLKFDAVDQCVISEKLAEEHEEPSIDAKSLQGVFYEVQKPADESQSESSLDLIDIEELIVPDFNDHVKTKERREEDRRMTAEEAAPVLDEISSIAGAINNNVENKAAKITVVEQPKAEPKKAEAIANQVAAPTHEKAGSKTLAESISTPKRSLNETIATAPSNDLSSHLLHQPIADLRSAISFNEKFQMIKELFAGDAALYERTIADLNKMNSLDESLIYIGEKFSWDVNSEMAVHLVDLLQRKFN